MDNFLITDTSQQPIAIDMHKFAQLYDTYANAVYANILRLVKRPECAEDLLQEVFSGYKDQKVFVNWISVFDGKDPEGKIKKPKKVPFNPYYEGNASVFIFQV